MTAVLSPTSSSPSSSPRPPQSSSPNPNIPSLPPLVTNSSRGGNTPQRQSSYAKARLSTYSQASNASQRVSRPSSTLMPMIRSSLPYAQVRDFAYAVTDPLHFGPLPISAPPSGQSTPAFESQLRLGDLPSAPSELGRNWSASWGSGHHEHLPQVAYSGGSDDHGPPYSEDEDLQSPVVVTSRHRRWPPGQDGRSPDYEGERSYFAGVNGDGSETYYLRAADEMADGPGGELVTYASGDARHSSAMYNHTDSPLDPGNYNRDESRYSREYQFTIASPDEEMHGKAVALFDFARENENELPLVEGQVIWVSYRHGQGWLVAEDPRTQESGLVPEEYVRLLRDIEGGWSSLNDVTTGQDTTSSDELDDVTGDTEVFSPKENKSAHRASGSTGSNGEKHPAVVSTFSTSSKDLDHYPHPELSTQTGQQPPQVIQHNQANTPTTIKSPVAVKKADGLEKDKKEKSVKRSASSRSQKENRR